MTFTKEQLIARAETVLSNARTAADFHDSKPYHLMDVHLAEIALASLEAEPVAWLLSGGGAKNHISFDSGNAYADPLREVTPLYTAPPAPVALTSGYSDFEEIWSSSTHPLTQDDEMKDFAWDIWNACRAAMLQGAAQPQNAQQNIPENIPTLREGVAAIRNSGIAIDAEKIQAERDALNEPVHGWIPCSERMPDPDSKFRVCAYTPSPHEDLRYRFVPASLFKSVCRDATHWKYMQPPAAPQQEVKSGR